MESVARFESRLPKCNKCGGFFRYMNSLLCPHCNKPFIDFNKHPEERKKEYYGNYLYGGSIQVFECDGS
jgi:predicted amidophosphoribosyltransferase